MPRRLGGPGTDIHEMPALGEEQLRELFARREASQVQGNMLQPKPYGEVNAQAMHRTQGMMEGNGDMRGDAEIHSMNNVGHRQGDAWYR